MYNAKNMPHHVLSDCSLSFIISKGCHKVQQDEKFKRCIQHETIQLLVVFRLTAICQMLITDFR